MSNRRLIICSAPAGVGTGSNFGMQTVDFAAHNLIKRLKIENCAQIHRPWPAVSKQLGGDEDIENLDCWPTKFETSSKRDAISDGDLVLTWGDFQLGHDYQIQSAKRYRAIQSKSGTEVSEKQAVDWAFDYFLLRKALSKQIDVACFGTTLFQNRMTDWTTPEYADAMSAYSKSCVYAKFRDPYSAWSMAKISGSDSQPMWGIDCALLNTPEQLLSLPKTGASEKLHQGSIGVYLGRSSKRLSKLAFAAFLKRMSSRIKSPICWIPWNRFTGGKLFARKPRTLRWPVITMSEIPDDRPAKAGDVLSLLANCRLIVTDTYHVAINAMSLRIPVLCIYEPTPARDRDANMGYRESLRDKRALLFSSTNQADLLMPADDLKNRHWRDRKIEHVASLLKDDNALTNWKEWLDIERDKYQSDLDQFISKRLNLGA